MVEKQDRTPGATDTAQAIAQGTLSAERATRAALERIEVAETEVQAWVRVDAEAAIAAARALDAGPIRGPLHGVPLGVKDIFAVRDLPWRCGSPIWTHRIAEFDAGSVALARAAGAVILGKTETTEFAGYNPTRTRNPFDLRKTPGGSSSGSAAAVACGMVPLALGTQTSGSIVRPASFCGVVGYKPSFDLIETGGIAPFARSLDTVGTFARSVADAALGVSALSGRALQPDASAALAHLRIYRSPFWDEATPALVKAWTDFEADLAHASATEDQHFTAEVEARLAQAAPLHARIMEQEAAQALAFEHDSAPHLLSAGLLAQLDAGRAMSPEQRAQDRDDMLALRHLFAQEVPRDAVWLTPSATGIAPDFEDGTGNPIFNRLWSLLGVPCCSVPLLTGPDGHPIGVQVVGAMGNDAGVLNTAHWLMQVFRAD